MTLERYRDLVDDWGAFREACARPEPTTFRIRGGRAGEADVLASLTGKGFGLAPVPGVPLCHRVEEEPYPLSQTLEHWLGLVYIQQAVTAVAAPALDPEPGQRILDLCAAPGGKTTHLADVTGDAASVVAVDSDDKRLRALLGNLYRLGHADVMVVHADARDLPEDARFDRVLADVPCSGEGNVRQRDEGLGTPDSSFKDYVVRLQEALLRKGVALTRPGGSILYSTCTFAPDENEGVVDAVLRDAPVTVEPLDLDVPHAPGLTSWEGVSFDARLRDAWRLYPHHLDSGGLFLCRLRRLEGNGPDGGWRPAPGVFPGRDTPESEARARVEAGARALRERFGVAGEALDPYRWTVRGNSIWAHRFSRWPSFAWGDSDALRVLTVGLRALKRDPRTPAGARPTNELLQRLGPAVTRRTLDLEAGELLRLLDGEDLEAGGLERGFAALRLEGRVVGRGWVKEGRVRNEISKGRAARLAQVLRTGRSEAAPTGGGEA